VPTPRKANASGKGSASETGRHVAAAPQETARSHSASQLGPRGTAAQRAATRVAKPGAAAWARFFSPPPPGWTGRWRSKRCRRIRVAFAAQHQRVPGMGPQLAAGTLGFHPPFLLLATKAFVASWTHCFALVVCGTAQRTGRPPNVRRRVACAAAVVRFRSARPRNEAQFWFASAPSVSNNKSAKHHELGRNPETHRRRLDCPGA